MPKVTVKIIIEGEPAVVEAIAQRASLFLDVQEEGKDIPLPPPARHGPPHPQNPTPLSL